MTEDELVGWHHQLMDMSLRKLQDMVKDRLSEENSHFIFLGYNITEDCDYSHEIKKCLLLGRKGMTILDSVLKSRHHFADKGPHCQSHGFPVVMYGCESWTIKKAEHQRIDAFEL